MFLIDEVVFSTRPEEHGVCQLILCWFFKLNRRKWLYMIVIHLVILRVLSKVLVSAVVFVAEVAGRDRVADEDNIIIVSRDFIAGDL